MQNPERSMQITLNLQHALAERSAFDQVSEFDRGRIVAYRDCGLSFKEIGSRVRRNQTTVMRICERWITTDVSAVNGPMKEECGRQNGMKLSLLTNHVSICNTTMVGFESGDTVGERILNSCVMHRHTAPPPGIMGLTTAIFQQDNAQPYMARIVQWFFVNHQIELLPCPARSKDLSPIENMWSMFDQQLTQITPPAATPDQLWQRVEASLSAVSQ
ncbi:transposable element Tcb1 transposase [Trichonephila clavipes]|nr:transposable element Tcb1 transposase [Trichonephila clavipes]